MLSVMYAMSLLGCVGFAVSARLDKPATVGCCCVLIGQTMLMNLLLLA
jgi:hypothetical protein